MSYELNRRLAERRAPLPTRANVDPVTAAILRGAFETVCYEAATMLGRSATSPIINSSNERNGSIVDAHGRLAAASIGMPFLTFVSQVTARYGLERFDEYDWAPGDVFVGNDPDYGGGHLPDYNVYAPVFDDAGELILIQCLQSHQADTGGKDPGGFTLEATDIFTEGFAIPCVKLVHRGEKRHDVIKLLERNNRFPSFAGDLAAMIGAVQHCVLRLQELIRKWGSETIKAAVNFSIDTSERRFRETVAGWPDGVYSATVWVDHDTRGVKDVKVHVDCAVKGDQLTVDLTGSDERQDLVGVWNTFANSRGYVMCQLAAAVDPSIVKNEGLFNAVEIVIPEGCILQPPPNKPAALGSFHPATELAEAVCLALSGLVPERSAPQLYKIGMPNAVIGFRGGQMWLDQGVDARCMDSSAVMGIDGWGSSSAALGNLLLSEAEDAESRFPVINISREMTRDAEGAGRWRGMPGSLNVKKVLEPVSAMAWMVSMRHPLRGMCGGDDASPYANTFDLGGPNEMKVEVAASAQLPAGAVIAYQHGGGGGFGPATERDPEAVKDDVLDELISVEAARRKYGVVLTGTVEDYDLAVDPAATAALRARMSTASSGAAQPA
jgi:N-methylhydantoinase B